MSSLESLAKPIIDPEPYEGVGFKEVVDTTDKVVKMLERGS